MAMAWFEPEVMCKMHPDQRQQPGFCSSCLREKLAKLPSFTYRVVPPSPSANYSRSSSPSICKSPAKHAHRRNSSVAVGLNNSNSVYSIGRTGLRKSRSIAYVARRRVRHGVEGKKKEGLWRKLIRSTSVMTKALFVQTKTQKADSSSH